MKHTIRTIALAALFTSTAFGAMPDKLPEFKSPEQLAQWREEIAAKAQPGTTNTSESHAFYTGKPYLASSGTYAFKYRSYNPELARWTSEDPSGFPDGANGSIYASVPTQEFDYTGLFSVNFNGFKSTSDSFWVTPDTKRTVTTTGLSALSASDFSAELDGWTFAEGNLDVTMKVNEYTPYAFIDKGQTNFISSIDGWLVGDNWEWIQIVTCNTPGMDGQTGTFLDNNHENSNPFYRGSRSKSWILDQPSRPYSQIESASNGIISWTAETYFVQYTGTNVTVFGGLKWGFTVE